MVHNPNEGEEPKREGSAPKQPNTDQTRRLPPDPSKAPVDPNRGKTAPQQQRTKPVRPRSTQIFSLEPPKRNKGTLARNTRIDKIGPPQNTAQRTRNLMGNIGRERTGMYSALPEQPDDQDKTRPLGSQETHPSMGDEDTGRRLNTRRPSRPISGLHPGTAVPDAQAINREAGEFPAFPADEPMGRARNAAPTRTNIPPVVRVPIPSGPALNRGPTEAPPPPGVRGTTLAGVSAEDLLGPEGRRMLEEMRKREEEARAAAASAQASPQRPQARDTRRVQGGPAQAIRPALQDAERRSFQEFSGDTQLSPEGAFLSPPGSPPAEQEYQQPAEVLSQGNAYAAYAYEQGLPEDALPEPDSGNPDEPGPRESRAHEELEQRAGYLLWLQGVITIEEVDQALTYAEDIGDDVRQLLAHTGFADQVSLYRFLARHESVAPVDLAQIVPSRRALGMLRPSIARAYRVIPFAKFGELLLVAAAFPFDPRRLLEIRRLTASKVKLYVATEEDIDAALHRYYGKPTGPMPGVSADKQRQRHITGEGEDLERKYDPTLSGEDSGLYPPAREDIPGSDQYVSMAEADDNARMNVPDWRGSGDATMDNAAIAAQQAAEEAAKKGQRRDIGGRPESSIHDLDQSQTTGDDDQPMTGGPEDHDPFKD